jgi:hypothetical protein
MKQVAGAAETLGQVKLNEAAARVMHTGLVVAYVRPFRSSGIGSLDEDDWAPIPPGDRAFHDMLVLLRNKVTRTRTEPPIATSKTPARSSASKADLPTPSRTSSSTTAE